MDISLISDLIGQTAFPIVAFILMYKMCTEQMQKVTDALNLLNTSINVLTNKIAND